MNAWQPYVQMPRKPHKAFRIRRDSLDYSLVQPDPYWKLYEHRTKTPQRIDSVLAVEPHRFLRRLLPVVLVSLLNILHKGLERAHGLDLPALLYCQRDKHKPHQ